MGKISDRVTVCRYKRNFSVAGESITSLTLRFTPHPLTQLIALREKVEWVEPRIDL